MSADRLSPEAENKKESWNAFPPESFGARPASMTEDLGPKTGHRHSLSLPNRIATLCRPLSGGGIDPPPKKTTAERPEPGPERKNKGGGTAEKQPSTPQPTPAP